MTETVPPSPRSTLKRAAERGHYDAETIHAIVDASYVCHVAWQSNGNVLCIPTACWRMDDRLYIHGSNGSRMMKDLAQGAPCCVTLTLLDGLVLAKSAFSHSMNYRSVVIHGQFELVNDNAKPAVLDALVDWIVPGRAQQARPADANELQATTVLALPLTEAAAKIRAWGPRDKDADADWPCWSGVLPMSLQPLAPQAHETPDHPLAGAPIPHWTQGGVIRN